MNIIESIILGIVQGLTELLPISSSAHLYLIPWFFNWNNIPESFDVALHFGTLLAIGLFFFKDWINLFKSGFNYVVGKKTSNGKFFWYIVLATIPGGAIGFLLDHFLEDILTQPIIIAISLIVMGIILYIVDKYCKAITDYEHLTLKQTLIIGCSQALAFIPGVSRSGITMTTGRLLKVDRESTAKFSFMLSTPIVFAATAYKFKDFIEYFSTANIIEIIAFMAGVATSFVIGIMVIKFLLDYLKKGSFKGFAIYRVLLGLVVIVVQIIK